MPIYNKGTGGGISHLPTTPNGISADDKPIAVAQWWPIYTTSVAETTFMLVCRSLILEVLLVMAQQLIEVPIGFS